MHSVLLMLRYRAPLHQDSLGGNCRTTIIATLSPSVDAFEESVSSLKFADRVSAIGNNPVVNTSRDMSSVLALKEREIQRLRQLLTMYANGEASPDKVRECSCSCCVRECECLGLSVCLKGGWLWGPEGRRRVCHLAPHWAKSCHARQLLGWSCVKLS